MGNEHLTDAQLAAIEAADEKRTPGEWRVHPASFGGGDMTMYKQPSWYKNKKLDLSKVTDQQLASFRDETERIKQENRAICDKRYKDIAALIRQAATVFDDKHPALKALRKALTNLEPPPVYVADFRHLERAVMLRREKDRKREQERERRRAREAELARQREQLRAKQRDYYHRHKQLMKDLKDTAILECGDPEAPYQLEASQI